MKPNNNINPATNVNPESSDDNLFAEETYQQEVDTIA